MFTEKIIRLKAFKEKNLAEFQIEKKNSYSVNLISS